MSIDENIPKRLGRLLMERVQSPYKTLVLLLICGRKIGQYLWEKADITEVDILALAESICIDEKALEDSEALEREITRYISFVNALLLLSTAVPKMNSYSLSFMIHYTHFRNNRTLVKWSKLQTEKLHSLSYRHQMCIDAVRAYRGSNGISTFPVCPRCSCTLEREYQSYCDRCGQALDWKSIRKARVIHMDK